MLNQSSETPGLPSLAFFFVVEERLAPADLVDHVLDFLRRRVRRQIRQRVAQIDQRGALDLGRLAEFLRRLHEVAEIVDGVFDLRVELGMGLRRHARPVAADEAPQRLGVLGVRGRHQREQHGERDRHLGLGRMAGMDVPDRIRQALPRVLPLIAVEELLVFVDGARDDVEVEALGRLRLAIHEQRQAFRGGIAQPFVDGEAVALRLGNLLAVLVEEQLVVEAFRRRAAERAADFARELRPNRSDPCRPSRSRRRARPSASPSRASIAACSARR